MNIDEIAKYIHPMRSILISSVNDFTSEIRKQYSSPMDVVFFADVDLIFACGKFITNKNNIK